MLIFKNVIVKKYLKIITSVLILLPLLFVAPAYASSTPMFSIYPAGGTVVNKDNGFTIDVMIDSGGRALTTARFVILFDPAYLQLTNVERNNSLFTQWPTDESTVDNTNGVVMLTGFSQSGVNTLYTTVSDPDVMARLTFKVVKTGKVTFDWAYSGADEDFKSVLLVDGSPPQNVLATKPTAVTFTISNTIANTAISWNRYILVGGLVLILFGALITFSKPRRFNKRRGTIVVYEE